MRVHPLRLDPATAAAVGSGALHIDRSRHRTPLSKKPSRDYLRVMGWLELMKRRAFLRYRRGLTQRESAAEMGVSRHTVWMVDRALGAIPPRSSWRKKRRE